MKRNKKILFSMVLVLMVVLVFGCSNNESSVQKNNIEKFINKKSELYDNKDEIINILNSLNTIALEEDENDTPDIKSEEDLNEALKDVKVLLTEKEYERLISNRYLIDDKLIKKVYDKSEIKNIEYEKISGDIEKAIYKVKYTENLYLENELKEERKNTNEFTLEKIDNEWLISRID